MTTTIATEERKELAEAINDRITHLITAAAGVQQGIYALTQYMNKNNVENCGERFRFSRNANDDGIAIHTYVSSSYGNWGRGNEYIYNVRVYAELPNMGHFAKMGVDFGVCDKFKGYPLFALNSVRTWNRDFRQITNLLNHISNGNADFGAITESLDAIETMEDMITAIADSLNTIGEAFDEWCVRMISKQNTEKNKLFKRLGVGVTEKPKRKVIKIIVEEYEA